MKFSPFGLALIFSISLASCGGGGSGSSDSPAAAGPSAEGFYGGALTGASPSNAFQVVILENGEFWAIYGAQQAPTVFGVVGFIQGTGTSNNGSFTAPDTRDFVRNQAVSASTNATYDAAAKTISGTISEPSGTLGFSGGPLPGSLYNYDKPASLSLISGAWSAGLLTGESLAINVAADGTFTASSNTRCNLSGRFTPRPSGKNVFNLSLTFGPPPCSLPGQTAGGIAIAFPLPTGKTQLIVTGTNPERTLGTAAFATR